MLSGVQEGILCCCCCSKSYHRAGQASLHLLGFAAVLDHPFPVSFPKETSEYGVEGEKERSRRVEALELRPPVHPSVHELDGLHTRKEIYLMVIPSVHSSAISSSLSPDEP